MEDEAVMAVGADIASASDGEENWLSHLRKDSSDEEDWLAPLRLRGVIGSVRGGGEIVPTEGRVESADRGSSSGEEDWLSGGAKLVDRTQRSVSAVQVVPTDLIDPDVPKPRKIIESITKRRSKLTGASSCSVVGTMSASAQPECTPYHSLGQHLFLYCSHFCEKFGLCFVAWTLHWYSHSTFRPTSTCNRLCWL